MAQHESVATDPTLQTAEQLRRLGAYGPVYVMTREPGYTAKEGYLPSQPDPDQRRIFYLSNQILTISDAKDNVRVTVDTPDGPQDLPLDRIERVGVDHPLGSSMPLHGRRIAPLVLMEWDGYQNVPRWDPRAYGRFDGSHVSQVLESGIDPNESKIGIVRAYDISTPWPRDTSLEVAKAAGRPYSMYFISQLGSVGVGRDLTVITSRIGYQGSDHLATVLPPKDPPVAKQAVNMLDVTDTEESDVYMIHMERIGRLAATYGEAVLLRQIMVDDAFLYMSHD